jgi:ABC-type nitrate/sulfonate/bicarbonate transport system permease component
MSMSIAVTRRTKFFQSAGLSVIGPIAFVAIWWLAAISNLFPSAILPAPPAVVTAAVLGIVIGIPAGYFRTFGRIIDPLIQLLRPIPVTAWVPLSLVFFGFGFKGAIFLIALGVFFPIVVNTIEGVRGANRMLLRVGRMLGATQLQMLAMFILPASLPAIFVGLRVGIGLAWVLVIVAELLSVKSGIGYTLIDAYSVNRYDVIISAMILLGVMGFLSDRIVVAVGNVLLRWHREMSINAD